jgi:hypothetical protein
MRRQQQAKAVALGLVGGGLVGLTWLAALILRSCG